MFVKHPGLPLTKPAKPILSGIDVLSDPPQGEPYQPGLQELAAEDGGEEVEAGGWIHGQLG